jgi:hypothetical protein
MFVSYLLKSALLFIDTQPLFLRIALLSLKSIILKAEIDHGDHRDVTKLATRLLNEACKTRVISKQEATCQLAGLDLYSCSEHVKMESLAGEHRLGSESQAKTSLLVKYAKRDKKLHKMNLIEFFDLYHNQSSNYSKKVIKTKIPLFTGARCKPVYPVTESYAQGVLLIYHPWHGTLALTMTQEDLLIFLKNGSRM